MAHTGSFEVEELTINGLSIGEIGRNFLIAGAYGVPYVFLSGDMAVCAEAEDLVRGILTAAVKEGIPRGPANGLTPSENELFNGAAVHLHPDEACERIRAGACEAIKRSGDISPLMLGGPYELVQTLRPTHEGGRSRLGVARGRRPIRGADAAAPLRAPLTRSGRLAPLRAAHAA